MTEFRARLARLGLRQAELRALIRDLTGHDLHFTTTSRYASGTRDASPEMLALLALIEDPAPLLALRQQLDRRRPT